MTKPDYREITDREDREELLKIKRIRAKLAAESAKENDEEQHTNEYVVVFITHFVLLTLPLHTMFIWSLVLY